MKKQVFLLLCISFMGAYSGQICGQVVQEKFEAWNDIYGDCLAEGEIISGMVSVHFVYFNGYNLISTSKGKLISNISGDTYIIHSTQLQQVVPDTPGEVFTLKHSFDMVKKGEGKIGDLILQWHLVVTPKGEISVNNYSYTLKCK